MSELFTARRRTSLLASLSLFHNCRCCGFIVKHVMLRHLVLRAACVTVVLCCSDVTLPSTF